ncbi:MAG: tetraacyldisaccharide 4'-kinase [Bacteroidetes bacterium]|nr:tetraacyldisaccharide 4'-kinase [Bacteroidota bacterium]
MKLYKILLLPISLLYGLIILIRNLFFDYGIFSSKPFKVPVIVVGNLSTGGTGKTPHIEYLVRVLKEQYNIAVLSRGYGRKTSGFILASMESTAREIGDEPLQIKKKNPEITVAVCASRVKGIKKILAEKETTDAILLDDAFQHRHVKASLSILLTDYSRLYANDFMLPSGNLREFANGSARADIIIVTKTPAIFSPLDRRFLIDRLHPKPNQKVFFSYTSYGKHLISVNTGQPAPFEKTYYFEKYAVLLITGIANAANIEYYIKNQTENFRHIAFPDHHKYSSKDLKQIKNLFDNIAEENKIIITTEKDAMRLMDAGLKEQASQLPILYLPIKVRFHNDDAEEFNTYILSHVKKN